MTRPEGIPKEVANFLRPDHFANPHHGEIYRAMRNFQVVRGVPPSDMEAMTRWFAERDNAIQSAVPEEVLQAVRKSTGTDKLSETAREIWRGDRRRSILEWNTRSAGQSPTGASLEQVVEKALLPKTFVPSPSVDSAEPPVVVFVAGPEGSHVGAASLAVRDEAGRGEVVYLGGVYHPGHAAYDAIREQGSQAGGSAPSCRQVRDRRAEERDRAHRRPQPRGCDERHASVPGGRL